MLYNRQKAVDYALKWALNRNPAYYNYDNIRWGLHEFYFTMFVCWKNGDELSWIWVVL